MAWNNPEYYNKQLFCLNTYTYTQKRRFASTVCWPLFVTKHNIVKQITMSVWGALGVCLCTSVLGIVFINFFVKTVLNHISWEQFCDRQSCFSQFSPRSAHLLKFDRLCSITYRATLNFLGARSLWLSQLYRPLQSRKSMSLICCFSKKYWFCCFPELNGKITIWNNLSRLRRIRCAFAGGSGHLSPGNWD